MPFRMLKILPLIGLALWVTACSSARSIVGVGKQSPDEFEVVTRAPLSLPPDYGLRAPNPNVASAKERSVTAAAREVIVKSERKKARDIAGGAVSLGESALLSSAGARNADTSIRALLENDNKSYYNFDEKLLEKVMFWQAMDPPGAIIDPQKEAKRIGEARSKGAPVNTGDLPIIERKERGFLEGLF